MVGKKIDILRDLEDKIVCKYFLLFMNKNFRIE